MNEDTLRRLIRIVEESQIDSLEIRRFFRTIRITKNRACPDQPLIVPSAGAPSAVVPAHVTPATAPTTVEAPVPTPSHYLEIKSPMVGTFYRAPSPSSPPFVDVGQTIKPGDVLCIIEAMKLMNEIEAEQGGRIAKVLVENAQPVEFGQPLFLLDPTA
ncbi:MAG: acetyl-CoA carboxylase biotin carboxyl carrier protein [Candidatus Zixiibacteriota bacterium]